MCGIAGLIDVRENRPVDLSTLRSMVSAIYHRGPDDVGFQAEPGLGLAACRLSIIDLAGGHQPISNEDGTIWVAFNGELFDYPEIRQSLLSRGHTLKTRCDTEAIVHLWEDYGEQLFDHLRGQFAFALWDSRKRCLILARDRAGICPLYWARRDDWLLFGSEIKAILASGMVPAQPDPNGLDHLFTYFCQASTRTCFAGVNALLPGHYLRIQGDRIETRQYWDLNFPDAGDERVDDENKLADELEAVMTKAVQRRLHSDVPVVSYLSGGVDSIVIAAMIRKLRGEPAPAFTVQVGERQFDETREAGIAADYLGIQPNIVDGSLSQLASTYPDLIMAAESPVTDTTCAAMVMQSRAVRSRGYKVALSGEGADEAFAGYVWFKSGKLRHGFETLTGQWPEIVNGWLKYVIPWVPSYQKVRNIHDKFGCMPAQMDVHNAVAHSRQLFYSKSMWESLSGRVAMDDFTFDTARIRRWHPLNSSLYFSYKLMLAGMLLTHKGDRAAMHNSVETRPPFLDEDVVAFASSIHPKYKLRGMQEKYLLRLFAQRLLPKPIAMRRKKMFRAPMWGSFVGDNAPEFVRQLLSDESLKKTQYFDPAAVRLAIQEFPKLSKYSLRRIPIEMGMINVIATQIWHHTFIDPQLADLPGWRPEMRSWV